MTEKNGEPQENVDKKQKISIKDLLDALFECYGPEGKEENKKAVNAKITEYLKQQISTLSVSTIYNILVLYDSSRMVRGDADSIYNSITNFTEKKPLLLVLFSGGGNIGSAYLIGNLCREYSNDKFAITVPRQAKSAATLLCCAADEIHMGSLSELGPIDPQINDLPALGLKHSIEHIAKLVKETPESAEMFAKYLHYSLQPIDLGYYERVAESAVQYAERLLASHADALPQEAAKIAFELVYTYKDHSFVIDKNEALKIFGEKIIKQKTEEYQLGNILYREISFIENIASYLGYYCLFIGSLDSEPRFNKK